MVAEEDGPPRRSLALPIAGVVLAALAIAAILVVRFGPWTLQPRDTAPVNTPEPAPAPVDTSLRSSTPYPPFDKMNQPGSTIVARHSPTRRATPTGGSGAPPTGSAQGTSGATGPASTDPAPGPVAGGAGAGDAGTSGAGTDGGGSAVVGGAAVAGGAAASGAGASGDGANAAPAGPPTYGIAVGTYMNESRATSERSKLREATKLSSRVMTVTEDNVSMYRVVVGSYTDRTAAERVASDLVQRGLVEEARVITMAPNLP